MTLCWRFIPSFCIVFKSRMCTCAYLNLIVLKWIELQNERIWMFVKHQTHFIALNENPICIYGVNINGYCFVICQRDDLKCVQNRANSIYSYMYIHVLFECHRAHWFYHQGANPWKRFEQTGDLNADNFKHGLGLVQWAHHEKKSNKMREKNCKIPIRFEFGLARCSTCIASNMFNFMMKYFSCDDQYTYNKNNDDEKIKRRMKMRTKSTD